MNKTICVLNLSGQPIAFTLLDGIRDRKDWFFYWSSTTLEISNIWESIWKNSIELRQIYPKKEAMENFVFPDNFQGMLIFVKWHESKEGERYITQII